jgi:hypothetical protein
MSIRISMDTTFQDMIHQARAENSWLQIAFAPDLKREGNLAFTVVTNGESTHGTVFPDNTVLIDIIERK